MRHRLFCTKYVQPRCLPPSYGATLYHSQWQRKCTIRLRCDKDILNWIPFRGQENWWSETCVPLTRCTARICNHLIEIVWCKCKGPLGKDTAQHFDVYAESNGWYVAQDAHNAPDVVSMHRMTYFMNQMRKMMTNIFYNIFIISCSKLRRHLWFCAKFIIEKYLYYYLPN